MNLSCREIFAPALHQQRNREICRVHEGTYLLLVLELPVATNVEVTAFVPMRFSQFRFSDKSFRAKFRRRQNDTGLPRFFRGRVNVPSGTFSREIDGSFSHFPRCGAERLRDWEDRQQS
jgi:hypothetical protein